MDLIAAESQLNALVERRAAEKNNANELEAMYAESTRRHREKLREQHRWEWVRFFDRMAASHAQISLDYQRRAEQLLEGES